MQRYCKGSPETHPIFHVPSHLGIPLRCSFASHRSLATRLRPQRSGSFSSSWAFNKNIFEDKEDAVGRACPMDIVPANTSWKAWETISSLAAAAAAIALDGRQSAFDFVSTYSHLIALCISAPGQTFRHSTEQRQQHHQPVICSAAACAAVGLEKPPFIPSAKVWDPNYLPSREYVENCQLSHCSWTVAGYLLSEIIIPLRLYMQCIIFAIDQIGSCMRMEIMSVPQVFCAKQLNLGITVCGGLDGGVDFIIIIIVGERFLSALSQLVQ